jgi:hypothetical protein
VGFDTLSALCVKAVTRSLGQTVTYTPDGGAGEEVTAVWFDDMEDIVDTAAGPIISRGTFVDFDVATLSQTPVKGDGVTRGGTVYRIVKVYLVAQGAARCKVLR